MHILLDLFLFIGIIWALAYFRAKPVVWTGVIAVELVVFSVFSELAWWFLAPVAIGFIAIAAVFNLPRLRKALFVGKVYNSFNTLLPPISATEQAALDAGDVWWEGELFAGRPDWPNLINLPKPRLTEEEQSFIDNEVNKLCAMVDDWKINHTQGDLSPETWAYLKAQGFFGLCISKNYGGREFSAFAHSTIVSKIATRSLSLAVNMMVPNSLGPAELVHHYGTDAQKTYYLPRLAKGEEVPCFALTAPEAGSDAGAIPDTGTVCHGLHDGKEVLGIKLNFDKRYITLAPIATVIGLAFKLYDPNKLLGDKESLGITVCLIPKDHDGIEVGKRHSPMKLAFQNGPVRGKDVFIPMEWIVGGADRIGQGWQMLMECLAIGRGISLPSLSTAVGTLSYRTTGAYAKVRKQFGVSIGQFEGIEEGLARIGGYTYMLEAARRMTAGAVDLNIKPALASAIAKYHMTEISRKVINDAMDIHAGKAIQLGPNNYIGLAYMAMPVSITVEGANILTRNLMIFGQGAMRCHPFVRDEIDAANMNDKVKGYQKFDTLLCAHIGYAVSNVFRSLFFGFGGWRFLKSPGTSKTASYYKQLTRMSSALALLSDLAMLSLGAKLKRKERLSARLGDVLSQLYLGSCVLKYYHDLGEPKEELAYVKWCIETVLYECQKAIDEFCINYPTKWLGTLMSLVIFPLDRAHKYPASDKTAHELCEPMMSQNDLRTRLTQYCYVDENPDSATGAMEHAMDAVIASHPLDQKLQSAFREGVIAKRGNYQAQIQAAQEADVLSEQEANQLLQTASIISKAIAVDEFNFDELTGKTTSCNKEQAAQVA